MNTFTVETMWDNKPIWESIRQTDGSVMDLIKEVQETLGYQFWYSASWGNVKQEYYEYFILRYRNVKAGPIQSWLKNTAQHLMVRRTKGESFVQTIHRRSAKGWPYESNLIYEEINIFVCQGEHFRPLTEAEKKLLSEY